MERRGVEYVFGLCGHTVIAMLDALSKSSSVKYVSFRNEQLAAMAADGYARIKKKAGVVIYNYFDKVIILANKVRKFTEYETTAFMLMARKRNDSYNAI